MKATGITRGIDQVGRIVIPKEIRENLNFFENSQVEFMIDVKEERLIIQKYQKGCEICGEMEDLIQQDSKTFCETCIEKMFEKTTH